MSQNTTDDEPKDNVVSLAARKKQSPPRRKIHGAQQAESVAPQQTAPVLIPPDEDPIVRTALSLVRVAGDIADAHPIQTMAAFKVALSALHESYLKKYGPEETMKIHKAASQIGSRYQVVFKVENTEKV